MNKDETLKNAFHIVRQTHIELASLYKDFEAEILSNKEIKIISAQKGNEVGTKNSLSIQKPDYWLYPFTSRYFVEAEVERPSRWYLGISMIHYNISENTPIEPRILIGIANKKHPYAKEFEKWWLVSMFESNYGREIFEDKEANFTQVKGAKPFKLKDGTWYKVIPELRDQSIWYDVGYLYSKRLTEIRNREDVKGLSDILISKFNDVLKDG
jgi:hypothetical protein